MIRPLASFLALALVALPATASASSYVGSPVVPTISGRMVAGEINWNCNGAACLGSTEESRPLVLCQGLAAKAGRLTSFLVDGRALDADSLAKCNAKAKGGAPLARAN